VIIGGAVFRWSAGLNTLADTSYDFWKVWDRVQRVGDHRVCIRALANLDVESWLGRTFESTTHLARTAEPKRTIYATLGDVWSA
jgi:hypothetical protein